VTVPIEVVEAAELERDEMMKVFINVRDKK